MKNLTKVDIQVIFPQGAHFYQNVNVYLYKSFINFIYKLSCFIVDTKCNDCSFKEGCQYYHCTGKNFTQYPGIVVNNPIFIKSIYQNEEVLSLNFYFIGNNDKYIEYIKIFFQSYLNQKIMGNYFYLKDIKITKVESLASQMNMFFIDSVIKTQDFLKEYNQMIKYYNNLYDTSYDDIKNNDVIINRVKKGTLMPIQFKTKKVIPQGYTYHVMMKEDVTLSSDILLVGVGHYNFIGGGHIEN